MIAACVWDFAGGRAPLSTFWQAARELAAGHEVDDESARAGARQGHLVELMTAAGLGDVREAELEVSLEHPTFEAWCEPYTRGVGPAGASSVVISLMAADRRPRSGRDHRGCQEVARRLDMLIEVALELATPAERLDLALALVADGHLAEDDLLGLLPDLWISSRRDCFDLGWTRLWRRAWERNGRRPVTDGQPVPDGPIIRAFLCQPGDFGVIWSLDRGYAEANHGFSHVSHFPSDKLVAYLTRHGASEAVFDPPQPIEC